jgi:sterol desaturase/sphingolipid hydroxylase (fatty acid hydroxylase superfamily)
MSQLLAYQKWRETHFRSLGLSREGVSIGAVLTVVVASIALAIGLYLLANFQLVLNTSGLPSAAQTAIYNVFATAYTAFQLLVVGLIVLAAVAILSILTGGFGMSGGGGGKRGKGAWLNLASTIRGWTLPSFVSRDGVSIGAVLTVVVAAIALAIGLYLLANFQLVLNTSGLPSAAQTAIYNVFATAYTAFQLLVVGLIVLAAVAILSILTGGFGMGGGGGGRGKGAFYDMVRNSLGTWVLPKAIEGSSN